ncbi:helix-turn-helix domain-containing protein [Piscinibacterium candidicorallinum]|uniref:Helix-turn-helix domain-containing protein n=1 Tax=Piscinibacterium candidicorallinum TaxID=1793872 RepID=A0ABV7H4Q2_9BURK
MNLLNLGGVVRAERVRQGLTQRQLAERSGVSYQQISLIESGRVDPRVTSLMALAGALGMRVALTGVDATSSAGVGAGTMRQAAAA